MTLSQILESGITGGVSETVKGVLSRTASIPLGNRVAGPREDARDSLRRHWPEYLMEGGELGLFMFSACVFAALLQHPSSPVREIIPGEIPRRILMGLAMAATAVAIICSPWGKQSGAHFNPAVTLSNRLGKIKKWDALFYVLAQFAGGVIGVGLASLAVRGALANEAVRYAVTIPGRQGDSAAFVAELVISFVLMTTVLLVSNSNLMASTALFVGALVAVFIWVESPLSGMSMNPARTFGSAFHAANWTALWIYFTAPPLGMLAATELFLRIRRGCRPRCAKLHHLNNKRCIFRCGYATSIPSQN